MENEQATQFVEACRAGDADAARRMLATAEINSRDERGDTALISAARAGHAGIVELLLEAGADRTITNAAGDTAESAALHHGHPQIAALVAPPKVEPGAGAALAAPFLWICGPIFWLLRDPFAWGERGRFLGLAGLCACVTGFTMEDDGPRRIDLAFVFGGLAMFFLGYLRRED